MALRCTYDVHHSHGGFVMLRSATLGTLTALVMTVGGVGVSQAASAATTAAETTGAASWGSTKAPDQ
eukprot:gene36880-41744_t